MIDLYTSPVPEVGKPAPLTEERGAAIASEARKILV